MIKLVPNSLLFLSLVLGTSIPLFLSSPSYAGSQHQCAKDALVQAQKLLSFYSDGDNRIHIDEEVKVLPSIHNPANKKMMFDVLEVGGYVHRARYRMRLIYWPINPSSSGTDCVLVGEEILEVDITH